VTWINLDDGILEHPKFIRAVSLGGSEALHLWLGLRAYCAKHLTDGFVPADMLNEVRGPKGRDRLRALEVLLQVGLLHRESPDSAVEMHDYLDWAPSRDDVLSKRANARERQAKSRGMSQRDSARSHDEPAEQSQPPNPKPKPKPNPKPNQTEDGEMVPARAPKARRAPDKPEPMQANWQPPESVVAAQVTRWQATREQVLRTVPEFRDYWVRDGKRRNSAGWIRAWTNRLEQLGSSGKLWVEDLRQRGAAAPGLQDYESRAREARMREVERRTAMLGGGGSVIPVVKLQEVPK
jgi:hypothetical protein